MKSFITPAYTFTPGASGVGTIDLSGITDFDVKKLVAVINQTRGVILYATGSEPLKYTAVAGSVITLNLDTSLMSSGDVLQVIYEQTIDFAKDATLNLIKGLLETAATIAKQEEIINKFGDVIAELALHGGKLPEVIGRNSVSGSLSVTLASDHEALNTTSTPKIQAGAITSVQKAVGLVAVRATVDGLAPNAARKKLIIKPNKNNTGNIFLGGSTVTAANGLEIIGPDRLEFEMDSGDYYLVSDVAGQIVEIIEKV